jgi:hypothetical protein
MLVTFKKQQGLKRPMNLTGVSKYMTGATTTKDLHTHDDNDSYIDHTIKRPSNKTTMTTMVVYADSTR